MISKLSALSLPVAFVLANFQKDKYTCLPQACCCQQAEPEWIRSCASLMLSYFLMVIIGAFFLEVLYKFKYTICDKTLPFTTCYCNLVPFVVFKFKFQVYSVNLYTGIMSHFLLQPVTKALVQYMNE